jgi:serine/threonine-protein kinase
MRQAKALITSTPFRVVQHPWSITSDGKRLAFQQGPDSSLGYDIWTVPLESDTTGLRAGQPEPFLQTPFNERSPAISPDGRWLAYESYESGAPQVYVRAFPSRNDAHQISSEGGQVPIWSKAGPELLFRTEEGSIMIVHYAVRGEQFIPETPRPWSPKVLPDVGSGRNHDLSPDGRSVVALVSATPGDVPQNDLVFLMNFFDEVRRRISSSR